MTSSMMTYSGAAIPSFFRKTVVSPQRSLSFGDWLDVFKTALAMTNAVSTTGRVSAKQVAHVRAMAEAI